MTTPTGPWYRQPRWRKPVLIGLFVGSAVVCAFVNAGVQVLVLHHAADDPGPYISGAMIGSGCALALSTVQPWGERRRKARQQNQKNE